MHEDAWAYDAQERASGSARDERTDVEQTAILHDRQRATDGRSSAGKGARSLHEAQHAVKKRRRARYVRRAERTGKSTVRGREESAVAVLATVGVSGQRVDNEQ